jgi:hypothetical protein
MKPIKKSEKILLLLAHKNSEEEEQQEQDMQRDTSYIPFDVATENHEVIENEKQSYIPVNNYKPIISSIGNSGWQISDVWRDIRVDNFSD